MSKESVYQILEAVQSGDMSVSDAVTKLKMEPFQDLGFAKVDHHRAIRQGTPEIIYGAGKTPEQIIAIASAMLERRHPHRPRRRRRDRPGA